MVYKLSNLSKNLDFWISSLSRMKQLWLFLANYKSYTFISHNFDFDNFLKIAGLKRTNLT